MADRRLDDYPFPLPDVLAWLRLPRGLTREEAERLKAYIDSLVTTGAEEGS